MDRSLQTSPRTDRGEPLQGLSDKEDTLEQSRSNEMATPTSPRIGGALDKVPWTGGSNLAAKKNTAPIDVLCFRLENFREMQKQHDSLKQGLPVEQRLELGEGGKHQLVQ